MVSYEDDFSMKTKHIHHLSGPIHKVAHIIIAAIIFSVLFLGTQAFSDDKSDKNKFLTVIQDISGEVLSIRTFEELQLKENTVHPFFEDESYKTGENGNATFQFSNTTQVRIDKQSELTILQSDPPKLLLKKGRIWVFSVQPITIDLLQSSHSMLAGSAEFGIEDGVQIIKSWEYPIQTEIFDKNGSSLSTFLIPTRMSARIIPEFFEKIDFTDLRYSKILREFRISGVKEAEEWGKNNIASDRDFLEMQKIKNRDKGVQNNPSLKIEEGVFTKYFIKPLTIFTKKEDDQIAFLQKESVEFLWNSLQKGNPENVKKVLLEKRVPKEDIIKILAKTEFLIPNEFLFDMQKLLKTQYIKKTEKEVFLFIWLEKVITNDKNTSTEEQKAFIKKIISELDEILKQSKNSLDPYRNLLTAILKNANNEPPMAIIDYLQSLDKQSISLQEKVQELEILKKEIFENNTLLSIYFIENKFLISAEKILSYMRNLYSEEELSEKHKNLLDEIEIRIAFERQGGGTEEEYIEFKTYYLSQEKTNANTSITERVSLDEIYDLLIKEEFEIERENVIQQPGSEFLRLESVKTPAGLFFSSLLEIDSERNIIFKQIYFYILDQEIPYGKILSMTEMKELKEKDLEEYFLPQPSNALEPISSPDPSNDYISLLSYQINIVQKSVLEDFDGMFGNLEKRNIDVKDKETAIITNITPVFPEGEEHEKFSISFTYNIKTKKVTNAKTEKNPSFSEISVDGPLFITEVIKEIDGQISAKKIEKKALDDTLKDFKSTGFSVEASNFEYLGGGMIRFTDVLYQYKNQEGKTQSLSFSGMYRNTENIKIIFDISEKNNTIPREQDISLLDFFKKLKDFVRNL